MSAKLKANGLTEEQEQDLLREIRENFDYATEKWQPIRDMGDKCMKAVAGDPWDEGDKKARLGSGRPALSLDELGQYINQTINDVRANPRGVKFSPIGNGANDKTAQFYEAKMREIEYRSHGQMVYTTAFENAVQRSYGFARVTTRRQPRSFNQELWLEPFVDPNLVTPDPDFLRPDGSDWKFCFVSEKWKQRDFKTKFKDAQVTDFGTDAQKDFPRWVQADTVQLAEYWKVQQVKRTLVMLKPTDPQGDPTTVFLDELKIQPSAADMLQEPLEVDDQKVVQCLTNGVEILEVKPWMGKYIPIAACFGKVLYLSNGGTTDKRILSMVTLALDPCMLYCYYRSSQAEVVGMTPKTPYMAYEGQFSPEQLVNVQKSLHEPVAVLFAKPTIDGVMTQGPLPLPTRQPYVPEIAALELGAESARRAIQAAMGISPLPSNAQKRNEKSGKALQQIEASSARGSFHFVDHYEDMIRHIGVIVEDLLDKAIDTKRDVPTLDAEGNAKVVAVNNPQDPESISTKGDHVVTISAGPAFDSQREAASDFADTLAQIPQVFAQCADLIVRLKNLGPVGDALAERLTPPEYRKAEEGTKDPQALARENAELKGMLQKLQQAAQQMQQALETEQAKQQAAINKAMLDGKIKQAQEAEETKRQITIQSMKDATAIRIELMKLGVRGQELETETALHVSQLEHEANEAMMDRTHDAAITMLTPVEPEPVEEPLL